MRTCVYQSDTVKYLLDSPRLTSQTINAKDSYGRTALHIACMNQEDAVEHLLNCDRFTDLSVNAVTDAGSTALHVACGETKCKSLDILMSSNRLTVQTFKITQRLTDYIGKLNSVLAPNPDPNTDLTVIELRIENINLKRKIAELELGLLEPLSR